MIPLRHAMLTWNSTYCGTPDCKVVIHPKRRNPDGTWEGLSLTTGAVDCWWNEKKTTTELGCLKPRNGWDKQDYVEIDSHEGKEIVNFYCGGN